ncbi:hypothetical protein AVEN_52840-1 [Araneus ventricosus]|uniref:Uncharacterized protein n=1 Tax=Araneus ventricosus TaxID=182803 RepID=A0A4Y2LI05_ARAVE|nr:hypothetical protein AVEN_52840-1 [Araneus ventricosus]
MDFEIPLQESRIGYYRVDDTRNVLMDGRLTTAHAEQSFSSISFLLAVSISNDVTQKRADVTGVGGALSPRIPRTCSRKSPAVVSMGMHKVTIYSSPQKRTSTKFRYKNVHSRNRIFFRSYLLVERTRMNK